MQSKYSATFTSSIEKCYTVSKSFLISNNSKFYSKILKRLGEKIQLKKLL